MSAEEKAESPVARFVERYGIHRRRTYLAGAALGGLLLISLSVMNQRARARQTMPAEGEDSTAVAIDARDEPAPERAAWADPVQARQLAGDTLPAVPGTPTAVDAGEYVPLGRELQSGEDAENGERDGRGSGGDVSFPVAEGSGAAAPVGAITDAPPLTPADVRRAAYQRAVASRRLRVGARAESAGAESGDTTATSPAPWSGSGSEQVGEGAAGELRPYGAAEIEEDRRAAEKAGEQLSEPAARAGSVPDGAARATFASFSTRPCRRGERVLSAGMVITATLASSINSEAAGPVLARIGRDVYDAALRCVILPAGSLLVGRYPEGLGPGGERLVVVWEQVVLGDGRTWMLPSLPAADRQGRMGIAGDVDRRTREILEAAALLSAFGAAIAYASPAEGQAAGGGPGGYPAAPSAGDRATSAATEPFRNAGTRLLDRAAGIRPVLGTGPGEPITVIVPRNVDLDRPAAPPPADSAVSRAAPAAADA